MRRSGVECRISGHLGIEFPRAALSILDFSKIRLSVHCTEPFPGGLKDLASERRDEMSDLMR